MPGRPADILKARRPAGALRNTSAAVLASRSPYTTDFAIDTLTISTVLNLEDKESTWPETS
jgi:hypothetical protein